MRLRTLLLPLVIALLSLGQAGPAFAQADTEALARRLLNSQGCKACHRIDGQGGSFAPDLDKVGSRLTREQLRTKLANPQKRHAGGRIADFSHLPDEGLDALAGFLSGRR